MFLICGEALWDMFAVEDSAAKDGCGLSFDARIGGSPFNVAVGLARLGQDAALLTGLSTDRLGDRLNAALDAEGVATQFLVRRDRPSTISLVDLAPNGSPIYAFYGADAADRAIEIADLPNLGPEVWGVHAGSFSLVTEPVGSSLLALFEREAGRRLITLDPNVRLNVEPDRDLWRRRIDAFVRHSDLVKVSAEDLELLYPGEERAAIASRWLDAGAALVVITRGVEGAEGYRSFGGSAEGIGGPVCVPGVSVTVVDTVGAGDSFQAGLIAGLCERSVHDRARLEALADDDIADLIGFAVRAAAITCTRRGADLPHRDELPRSPKETV